MKRHHNTRREVAEAAIVLDNELPAVVLKPSRSNFLIDTAKRLQRLQTRRAKLRREMKTVEQDIRLTKRELRAVAMEIGRGK